MGHGSGLTMPHYDRYAEAGLMLVAFDRRTLPWHAGQVLRTATSRSAPTRLFTVCRTPPSS